MVLQRANITQGATGGLRWSAWGAGPRCAVVHAPLAAILILLDLTGDYPLALLAMLASILATGTARRIFPESIYTMSFVRTAVRRSVDQIMLRWLHVEQVQLGIPRRRLLHPIHSNGCLI